MRIDVRRSTEIKPTTYGILYPVLFFLAVAGCSQESGKGIFEVRIKDHEEAIGYFSKVNIVVETIRFSPKVGFRFWRFGWLTLNPSLDQLDLTQFVNNSGSQFLEAKSIPAPLKPSTLKFVAFVASSGKVRGRFLLAIR
jgi:hypothetical protein